MMSWQYIFNQFEQKAHR